MVVASLSDGIMSADGIDHPDASSNNYNHEQRGELSNIAATVLIKINNAATIARFT